MDPTTPPDTLEMQRAGLPTRGRELYVYYKVPEAAAAAVLAAVRALQQALIAEHPALTARLLWRPGNADGPQTWMEIYAIADPVGDVNDELKRLMAEGVGTELQARIERRAATLEPYLASPRHVEVFRRLDPAR